MGGILDVPCWVTKKQVDSIIPKIQAARSNIQRQTIRPPEVSRKKSQMIPSTAVHIEETKTASPRPLVRFTRFKDILRFRKIDSTTPKTKPTAIRHSNSGTNAI